MKEIIKKFTHLFLSAAILVTGSAFVTTTEPVSASTSNSTTTAVSQEQLAADAKAYFKNLSAKERKAKMKDAKQAVKQHKKDKKAGKKTETDQLLLVILAILIPPLAVYLHEGEINGKFWLDLILTLLFFLPGIIYALIVIL